MQNSYEITGEFSDDCGSIHIDHANMFSRIFSNWKNKPLYVVVGLLERDKSVQQVRYFHAVIVKIIRAWLKETQGVSLSVDETRFWIYVHLLEAEYIEKDVLGNTQFELNIKTLRNWTTKDFNQYKEIIQAKMAIVDVYIPDPDPNYYTKL